MKAALAIGALAALMWGPAQAQEANQWQRVGRMWVVQTPPVQNVDQARLQSQINAGCGASAIGFGDTSVMRALQSDAEWPRAVRDAAAAATFVDAPNTAYALLAVARDTPGLTLLQQQILENQHILSALQFGEPDVAQRLLQAYSTSAALPGPILSDRLFWQTLIAAPSASATEWRARHLETLDAALRADPSSFQVRVWRVLGWMNAQSWKTKACGAAIADFSDRLLDLSEVGACPLMISHFAHAMDRNFGAVGHRNDATDLGAWRRFATGILARIAQDPQTATHMQMSLANAQGGACSGQMAFELAQLGPGQ